jgi:hypothetical protein
MGAMAASDHQGRREGEGLGAKGRRGRFLVQVRPPGAQHLDVGLGSARAVGAVHGEKDPSPGSVPLVKVPGEVVQAPMKGLGHPGVAAAFHVIKHLERQGPLPHFPGMAANLTENNLTFTGWQINGAGTVYTQGQTFSMGSANVTLEAKWTPVASSWTGIKQLGVAGLCGRLGDCGPRRRCGQ